MTSSESLHALSCDDDYDPESMPVDKARTLIRRFLSPIADAERVPIRQALGRILAEDVVSPLDVPGADNSAMDGYAVRHCDLSGDAWSILTPRGESLAGRPFNGTVGAGECVRIFTGAVIPSGADSVVMQEQVRVEAGRLHVPPGVKHGQNRRCAGEDLARGSIALKSGQCVRPAELGLIASLGIDEVSVYRRLRVAFFSTGDELKSIGTPLAPGDVYDSNRYTLFGMLTRLGCDVHDLGVVPDVPALLKSTLQRASRIGDVVITSGGVSVGEADYVKQILAELGEVLFWKIAMKPGRPLAYGKIGTAHFFGLPGNPVSVMATFYQFVREALMRLQGQQEVGPTPTLRAKCTGGIKKVPGRTEFQRGILRCEGDEWTVATTGGQGSGILSSMTRANCFIVLPAAQGNVEPGAMVDVQLLEGLI